MHSTCTDFFTVQELHMFEELIKLPKIGPKSAMQVLMQADVATLKKAILTGDPVYLTKDVWYWQKNGRKDCFGTQGKLWR